METVFSTEDIVPSKRYSSWRDAICDVYVHVDVSARHPEDYRGFIREARFGELLMTDVLLSEQRITRKSHHISQLDKDCYYLQLIQRGNLNVVQRGEVHSSNAARGAVFCATEQYELQCLGEVRSFYLEIPRDKFARRFPSERVPVSSSINSSQGLGRIATEFCAMLAVEGGSLSEPVRAGLGNQLMDILAFTLLSTDAGDLTTDGSIQQARLRSVQGWIEEHLVDPDLSLEKIARSNNMSLRYLHLLFRQCDMSVSDWLWSRRLQRSYDAIEKGGGRPITSIAFDHGFNSSGHFSTLFRQKYGVTPREVSRTRRT